MAEFTLRCQHCQAVAGEIGRCSQCGGVLETAFPVPTAVDWQQNATRPGIWRFAPLLPVRDPAAGVTMGEGNTPLIRSVHIGPSLGVGNLWFKLESSNPTGSYKDRIAAVAMTRALELGRRGWIGTSSGNGGAAAAAFGARAKLPGIVCTPPGAAPAKLAQIQAYGAAVVTVPGFGSSPAVDNQIFALLGDTARQLNCALFITAHAFDPCGMDGATTIAFEIAESLSPERVYVPAGGGGLATSVVRGFREWHAVGRSATKPAATVVQPTGSAAIAKAWQSGRPMQPLEKIESAISGVQLTDPPDGHALLHLLKAEGGNARAIDDDNVYAAQARLAAEEGIFVEPAGALSLAGFIADLKQGQTAPEGDVVCILTGSGFKDRDAVERMAHQYPAREISGPLALPDLLRSMVE